MDCKYCEGTGLVAIAGEDHVCKECDGTGEARRLTPVTIFDGVKDRGFTTETVRPVHAGEVQFDNVEALLTIIVNLANQRNFGSSEHDRIVILFPSGSVCVIGSDDGLRRTKAVHSLLLGVEDIDNTNGYFYAWFLIDAKFRSMHLHETIEVVGEWLRCAEQEPVFTCAKAVPNPDTFWEKVIGELTKFEEELSSEQLTRLLDI